jgi:hypothetical protein
MAVSTIRKAGDLLCKESGMTGMRGLDGKLYEVADYKKKIRGGALRGIKFVIVPRECVEVEEGGSARLMESVKPPGTGRLELAEVRVEKSVHEGPGAVTVIAADTILDVMDLLLISNREGEASRLRDPGMMRTQHHERTSRSSKQR